MSVTHKYASRLAKAEGGKSEIKIGDMRQVMALLKKQHRLSRKGDPSILRQLMKEAGHKP